MKKIIPVLGLCMLPFLGQARHNDYRGAYLGLMGELSYIKESSESCAMAILNSPNTDASLKSETIDAYNNVKQVGAQLTAQISADARSKNSLRDYQRLDQMLTCHSIAKVRRDFHNPHHYYRSAKLEAYVYNLLLLEKAHAALMRLRNRVQPDVSSWSNLAGSGASYSNTRGYSKVANICSMLEQKTLRPVTALMQKPEKKQEQTMILKAESGTDIRIIKQPHCSVKAISRHRHVKGKKCTCR